MLVGVVEGGAYEGRHGSIDHNEVLVAVGLGSCDLADKGTGVGHHGPARLNDDGQTQALHRAPDSVDQVLGEGDGLSPAASIASEGLASMTTTARWLCRQAAMKRFGVCRLEAR